MTQQGERGFWGVLVGDGRPLFVASAFFLFACGAFAAFQATTGELLPHDAAFLQMSAADVCAASAGCHVLHFMIHDRVSFAGVLGAISVLYLWLALVPLREGESWAWWALALSGLAGFLSFLSYLGYGYLDTWHGAGTLVLLPIFAGALFETRGSRRRRAVAVPISMRSAEGVGRALLLLASVGIAVAGTTITIVGMTQVFVPQDLEFMGTTRAAIAAINAHLVPLIAHDRAGFGGALVSFSIAMFMAVRYGRASRALWEALAVAELLGFGATFAVHGAIGYLSLPHLAPAVLGFVVYAAGLALAWGASPAIARPSPEEV